MDIETKIKTNAKNPKKLWDTLRQLTTNKTNKTTINSIKTGQGTILTDQTEMAEEFNNFFASAGRLVHDSVNPINKTPLEFIPIREHPPPLTWKC